jgi:signal transduction histidine kinase
MSLKTRIILLTVLVTATIVSALFVVQLNNVVASWLNSSTEIAEIAGQQIKNLLIVRLAERSPAESDIAARKAAWTRILREDHNLTSLLEVTLAQGHSLIEISVAGQDNVVIASSNPLRVGQQSRALPNLEDLNNAAPFRRAMRLMEGGTDYELKFPIGLPNETTPTFTIHVLVSSVLLRDYLTPAMRQVTEWAVAALLVSIVLAYASAKLATSSVTRLGTMIDRIASGDEASASPDDIAPSREFAAIESKLDLLGHQVRGFRSNVQRLLERLEEAILLIDSEQRIVIAGGAAEQLLGSKAGAMVGRQLSEILPPDTGIGSLTQQAFLAKRELRDEVIEWKRGDTVARLSVTIEFMADSPESKRFTALMKIRDAEVHRQVASRLGMSARIDAINRITSSVAHEIKNPLNSIAVRLDNLHAWATGDFPEAGADVELIVQEVNRLDRVVRAFLDFTRPVEMERGEIDAVALVRDIATLLEPDAARRSVRVRFSSNRDSIPVCGDQDFLKEAILNIVTNGVEAMPDGGELLIRVEERQDRCRITITDTGVGIPAAERERIFELYFSTKKGGSGLGLPMAYRTVELHGGSLDVNSEPGKGTSFRLELPVTVHEPD